jgi:hypothetical protein
LPFPLALTIIGVGVIFLGIRYRWHRPAIERAIQGYRPASPVAEPRVRRRV